MKKYMPLLAYSKILPITACALLLFGCTDDDRDLDLPTSDAIITPYSNEISEAPPVEPMPEARITPDYAEPTDPLDQLTPYYNYGDTIISPALAPELEEVKPAITNNYQKIQDLNAASLDWGPGGPVDELNRSVGALDYQQKYSQYDAIFIADEQPIIYLSFDEGYDYGLTVNILDTLKEKDVKATFYLTYDFAKTAPDTVQRMIDEGHTIGNHSYTHKNYSTLAPIEMADDLMKMHDYILNNFDYTMSYFRFPAGNFNEQGLALVQQLGYKSIFWSFAYKDWLTDDQPDTAQSLQKLIDALCPGNIYLLHSVSSTNDKILGDFIDAAREQGYTFGDPNSI